MKMKEVILKISEAFQQDVGYGRARIDHQSRIELDLSIGDVIEIEGTKTTAAVVWRAHPTDEGKRIIRIDNLTRRNSGAGLGDRVKIRRAEVKEAKNVVLAPLISKGQQIQFGGGIEVLIKKGLLKRPLTSGDHVIIPGIALFGSALPFIIINTTPNGIVSINEITTIQVKEEAAKIEEGEGSKVSYEDIGGLKDELEKVKEMIQLPIKHPKIFNRLGIDPPKGVLLHGPPGTGKTLIAKAVANESGANFYTINGPEIMCVDGETKIFTNPDGHIKAKDVFKNKGKKINKDGCETIELKKPVSTFAFKNSVITKAKITHVTKLKSPTYEIKLSDGNSIKTSHNQPFLVYSNGELIWKRVNDLEQGDYVARINNIKTDEKPYGLRPKKIQNLQQIKNGFVIKSKNLSRSNIIKLPEKTTEELLEFLGLIVSDGNISKKGDGVTFANNDIALKNRFKELLKYLFDIKKTRDYPDGRVVTYSKTLVLFLKHIGFEYDNKSTIPGYFYKLPKKQIQAFIRGYFDGDGTVAMTGDYPSPMIYCKSKKYLHDLQALIQIKLQISSKICEHKTQKGLMFKLVVRGYEGRCKFLEIGSTTTEKRLRLEKIKNVKRIKEFQDVPNPSTLIKEIKSKLPYKEYRNKDYYVYGAGNITKHSLNILYNLAEKNNIVNDAVSKEFSTLLRDDIGWEKIVSKKYIGECNLYDFTVDKDSFIGGSYYFMHNSKFYGQSEENLRKIFEDAEKNAPSIIFIDEIDAIAGKRSETHGEVEKRVVSQMLTLMDGLKGRGNLIVIGATNIPDSLDPALRRPGRFDREIRIDAPDRDGRKEILQIHTRSMPKAPPFYKSLALEELKKWMKEIEIPKLQEQIRDKKIEEDRGKKDLKKYEKENASLLEEKQKLERELAKKQQEIEYYDPSKIEKIIESLTFKKSRITNQLNEIGNKIEELIEKIKDNKNKILELEDEIKDKKALKELFELEKKIKLSDGVIQAIIDGQKEIEHRMKVIGIDDPRYNLMKSSQSELDKILDNVKDEDIKIRLKEGFASEEVKNNIKKRSVDVMLNEIADVTYGYVGADLMALARESAMNALRRYLPEIDLEKPIPVEILEKMEVTLDDFKSAHRGIEPSAMREFFVEVPKVTWGDVGGLDEVRQSLIEAIEWPLTQPEVFKRMGIKAPRGILLYGPPGTGKTLLAKAVAHESKANFISIKGPEVLSKWVGESEKAIRELFKKARQVAPTIIFLDEIDSIAPRRGQYSGSHVTESVVNQLLTSMDGLESMDGVVVLGATNKPDMLDPALLRPGRFDRLLLTSAPNIKSRFEIFKIHTKGMPLVITEEESKKIDEEFKNEKMEIVKRGVKDEVPSQPDSGKLGKKDTISVINIKDLPDKDKMLYPLAAKTEGFSGADIEGLCREAAMLALRADIKSNKVDKGNFEQAMKDMSPSITKDLINHYKRLKESRTRDLIKDDKRDRDVA